MIKKEKDKVVEFIGRRFPEDCRWLNGNCYYFSVILKERFPEGEIWYDMIDGHFLFECGGRWYDWTGLCEVDMRGMVRWDKLENMDKLLYDRIVRDCVR